MVKRHGSRHSWCDCYRFRHGYGYGYRYGHEFSQHCN